MRIIGIATLVLLTFASSGRAETFDQLIGRANALIAERQYEQAFEALRLYAINGLAPVQYELAQAYEKAARDINNFERIETAERYVSHALSWYLIAGENGHEAARIRLIQFMSFKEDPTIAYSEDLARREYIHFVCWLPDADFAPKKRDYRSPFYKSLRKIVDTIWFKIDCERSAVGLVVCSRAHFTKLSLSKQTRAHVDRLAYAWLYGPITSWFWNSTQLRDFRGAKFFCPPFPFQNDDGRVRQSN